MSAIRKQIKELSHLIYGAYCLGRLGQSSESDANTAQLAAQVLGRQDHEQRPELPQRTLTEVCEIVANLLDPPGAERPVEVKVTEPNPKGKFSAGVTVQISIPNPGDKVHTLTYQDATLELISHPAAVTGGLDRIQLDILGRLVRDLMETAVPAAHQTVPGCTCTPVIPPPPPPGKFARGTLHAEQCDLVYAMRVEQAQEAGYSVPPRCDCAIGASPYTGSGPRHSESCAMVQWDREQRAPKASPTA
jgi:hypothetical protein